MNKHPALQRQLCSLCFIVDGEHVLLGYKKRGLGAGFWNGFGGKCRDGEAIRETAARELEEEARVTVRADDLAHRGAIDFFVDGADCVREVHVFAATVWTGEPAETDEMLPRWHHVTSVPYDAMWPDDAYWLPLLLRGAAFSGWFAIGSDHRSVYDFHIHEH